MSTTTVPNFQAVWERQQQQQQHHRQQIRSPQLPTSTTSTSTSTAISPPPPPDTVAYLHPVFFTEKRLQRSPFAPRISVATAAVTSPVAHGYAYGDSLKLSRRMPGGGVGGGGGGRGGGAVIAAML
ncbi:hypothetical protein F4778DRAFT_757456 [Xylariomycetidae sp. FL2044]|nr:hypothetical protein F4778DRAFT_757456 [Xylariomycetidae sp. FL2044]